MVQAGRGCGVCVSGRVCVWRGGLCGGSFVGGVAVAHTAQGTGRVGCLVVRGRALGKSLRVA
jgi:hypothetical protein